MLAMAVAVAVQPYLNANLLYKLAPVEVVGWYGVAWTIAGTLVAPSAILAGAVYPRFSKAADQQGEFQRVLRTALRPLLFIAMLGGVGTYLFADVAISLIYGEQRFGEAAAILRVFAPTLVLIYADMLFGSVIFAVGKAGRLASVKFAAVVITTGLALILIPLCQSRYGNGGIGVIIAMGVGEFLMVSAATLMVRETLDRRMLVDLLRALLAASATVLLMQSLPAMTPFLAIPACILTFLALSFVFGLVNRSDLTSLLAVFRKGTDPDRLVEGPT